ncbi:peptidase [Diaphorobacter nitroreducens]|uniref:PepSY-associated TM helix domain-containing protein n=1 Tax=Diaphorobacter nitroreducens TaxID=164759 RepID=UPI000B59E648|nr:PepSY-associated TM helix domain-containing protein [Diaphorobacter nitroreducens]ASI68238.1 peptidase [Diaphorobacter nitroreducens]
MSHLKRWMFLAHRWLGVALCVLFALWFVSGVVMMYVGYPKLTPAERLMHLPPLRGAAVALEPDQALAAAGLQGPLRDLRLAVASGGRAVYLATPQPFKAAPPGNARPRGAPVVIDARTGAVLTAVDAPRALASAAAYAQGPAHAVHEGTLQEDAFTHSRALDMHRPLHRVRLGDAHDTVLYISGTTGEVVRDATRTERQWNYAGAWLHWLYPLRGGLVDRYWADIVNALSLLGIAAVVTGGVIGILRWRFAGTYRSGRRTPFPSAWARWHHVAGLLFMVVTLAWIFSGLMSMNPWRIFDSGAPALRTNAMHGGPLQLPHAGAPVAALLQAASTDTRELRWTRTAGHTLVQALPASGPPTVLDAHTALPHAWQPGELEAAAARLVDAPLQRVETLRAYDAYYYTRDAHTMTGGTDKPLPVLRLVFGDPHASWVHLDPHTGAVLGRLDRHRRTSRWLFGLLHSWDWLPLLQRRPLWDVLLVALSVGGTVISLSGVVLGWRRVRRKLGWRTPAAPQAPMR